MSRPALNFYVKFTPGNFKSSGSARRARAIFGSALLALQNFISAFKFYLLDLALLLKFASQKSASVFKFSRRRFASNLRSALRAVFAAAGALFDKILSCKIPAPRNFALLNLTLRNSARQNFTPQNFDPQSSALQNFTPQKIARRNRASKIAVLQNFARLNLAASQNPSASNSAFKFKASADV